MKKYLAIILATLMLVACFAACTPAPAPAPEPEPDTESNEPVAPPEDEGVDTNTVAVGAVIIVRDDVPEDEVYALTSTIFENADAIAEQHAKGAELDLNFASSMTSIPYHPGAAKYFAEKGIEVAAIKEGAGTGEKVDLIFGTGGDQGTYYGFGGVLASFVSGKTDVSITAVTSDGSKANIEDLTAGDVQMAFVQSDVMSYAYNGERLFDTKVEGFSVVAAIYMEQVQIVTTKADIKSVADLAGKKVSIGAAGSGVYFNAIDVLGAYDLTEEDVVAAYQNFGDSADSLKDGKLDAAFIVAGAPTTAITDLSTTGNVYLVGLDEEHTAKLLEASPFYSAAVIPAGTY